MAFVLYLKQLEVMHLGYRQNHRKNINVITNIPSHGGNLFKEARRIGVSPHQLLDASASIVPFSPPKKLRKFLHQGIESLCLRAYPERSHLELKEAIGALHNIHPDLILPGNGASELFTWAARDASQNGLSGLLAPSFGDYERGLKCWHASYIHTRISLNWHSSNPQPFPYEEKANVLWITNPHNPTGQLWSRQSIEPLLSKYKLVICDEAFLPLVPDGEKESLVSLVDEFQNLIVIRSLTKLFAIAGLRLGYAISNYQRLKTWAEWRDPWPLNGLAIEAGVQLASDTRSLKKWKEKIHQWVSIEGAWLFKKLENLPGLKPYPSCANFFLIHSERSCIDLQRELSNHKILVRDCRSFQGLGEHWLRIGLQKRSKNIRIINTMKKILM